jgi:alanyl-tRNA synthetase
MLGIQVFNYPDKFVFFKDECVEFNYRYIIIIKFVRWLTEELGIDPEEITFVEDIWAGGGNLGPSVEYFVGGLEVGNMVFMQYKYFPDGSYEELPIKVLPIIV